MTAPETAARRFLLSCALGCLLGLIYGILRPFRHRFPKTGDALFLLAAFRIWLELAFGICLGDIRIGYLAGLLAGALLWELTLGRLLRPVFFGFNRSLVEIWGIFTLPAKKFWDFVKILFASAKKWVTIECTYHQKSLQKCGRRSHGTKKESAEKC